MVLSDTTHWHHQREHRGQSAGWRDMALQQHVCTPLSHTCTPQSKTRSCNRYERPVSASQLTVSGVAIVRSTASRGGSGSLVPSLVFHRILVDLMTGIEVDNGGMWCVIQPSLVSAMVFLPFE